MATAHIKVIVPQIPRINPAIAKPLPFIFPFDVSFNPTQLNINPTIEIGRNTKTNMLQTNPIIE